MKAKGIVRQGCTHRHRNTSSLCLMGLKFSFKDGCEIILFLLFISQFTQISHFKWENFPMAAILAADLSLEEIFPLKNAFFCLLINDYFLLKLCAKMQHQVHFQPPSPLFSTSIGAVFSLPVLH